MKYLDGLFQFWIDAHWFVALAVSSIVNVSIYVITAFTLSVLIRHLVRKGKGGFLDHRPLKNSQLKWEVSFGIVSCLILAVGSLATRELFHKVWPETLLDLVLQTVCFIIYYETYSYFVHLLLHRKPFKKYHAVHHRSVRVTPWSAYSVHPVEAAFIGFSAPLFMLIFPLSLGIALVLHIFGMMFTILLHSNFRIESRSALARWINGYPDYHSKHHIFGVFNFGFVGSAWDRIFQTKHKDNV